MSELVIYQPTICSRACVRSFALASVAPKINEKEEIIILSRLMSASLGYHSVFWNHLKSEHADSLYEYGAVARRGKHTGFLNKRRVDTDDHAHFVLEARLLFEQLDHIAEEFDRMRGHESGVRDIIKIAPAFIKAQNIAQTKSMENGLPTLHYINPYVAVNVAATVLFDISKDLEFSQPHRSPQDLSIAIKPLYNYLENIMTEYPVHMSPNISDIAYKNEAVREHIYGTYKSLEDHMRNIPNVSAETNLAALSGLDSIQNYLFPFVQNIKSEDSNQMADILTFSEWKPLVEAAREKALRREKRQQENPHLCLPRNDF